MSIKYRETFNIPGLSQMGIEDYEQKGDHFMPSQPHKRFKLWIGGGCFGDADTIEEARQNTHNYAKVRLTEKQVEFSEKLSQVQGSLDGLSDDVFNLGKYQKR